MDALGGIPIRRDRRDLLSVGRAEELLRAGECVAIFPQGTVTGGAWTRGAARLALTTGVPIVPVRIVGTARALSHRRIRFSKIRIVVGEPIQVAAARPTVAASRALTRELQASGRAPDVALAALRTLCVMPRGRGRAFDLMEPPERPADPAVRRAYLKRIVALFRPYRRRLAGVLALIIFSSALGVIPALLLREVIDDALPNGDLSLLNWLVAGMVGIAIVTGALGVVQTLLSNQVGQRVMHDLRTAVYEHLQRLSLAFFTRTRTGEVQSRLANDIGGVQEVVTSTATSIVSNVTTVLATVVAMFILDWRLTLFALALLPLFVWMTKRVGDQRRKVAKVRQESMADISSLVQESLSVSGHPARQDDGPLRRARRVASGRSRDASPTSRSGAG